MATLEQVELLVQTLIGEVQALPTRIKLIADQIVVTGGLSDIDTNLGQVLAGEFRAGNLVDPGRGFSGMRLGWPPFRYGGEDWHLVGVENDTLQVGVRASDGKLLAGAGQVILDATGVDVGAGKVTLTSSGIAATAGTIGGWTLSASQLSGGDVVLDSAGTITIPGVTLDSAGIAATAGTIGGWVLGPATLTGGVVTLNSAGSIAVPGVTLNAAGIQAIAGSIGGIEILESTLRSSNYSSGTRGFRLSGDGSAEFDNVRVRGEISSTVLTYNTVLATSGTIGLFYSAFRMRNEDTVAADGGLVQVEVDKDPEHPTWQPTNQMDLVYFIDPRGKKIYAYVDSILDMGTYWRVQLSIEPATLPTEAYTMTAGTSIVVVGPTGYDPVTHPTYWEGEYGNLILTADAPTAPHFSVRRSHGKPWEDETEIIRIGNLDGFLGTIGTDYGMAIGTPNSYMRYSENADALTVKGTIYADSGTIGSMTIEGNLNLSPGSVIKQEDSTGTLFMFDNHLEFWDAADTPYGVLGRIDSFLGAINKTGFAFGSVDSYIKYLREDDLLEVKGQVIADGGTLGDLTINGTLTMGAAGKLEAGGGTVVLDQGGVGITLGSADPNRVRWLSDTGFRYSWLESYLQVNDIFFEMETESAVGEGHIILNATGNSGVAGIGIHSDLGIVTTGPVKVQNNLSVEGDLAVTGSAPFAPSGFGLGGPVPLVTGVDINTLIHTGWYRAYGGANAPTNTFYYYSVIEYSASWVLQQAFNLYDDHYYIRRLENGVWQPWTRLMHTNDHRVDLPLFSARIYGCSFENVDEANAIAFPDSGNPEANWTIALPPGWGGKPLVVHSLWKGAASGNIYITMQPRRIASGLSVYMEGALSSIFSVNASTLVETTHNISSAVVVEGGALAVRFYRYSSGGSDTLAGNGYLMAAWVTPAP